MSQHVRVRRLAIGFLTACLAASLAAGVTLTIVSRLDQGVPAQPLGTALIGIGVASLLSAPVVIIAGLMVALPLDRLLLRRLPVSVFLMSAVVAGGLASLAAERIIFRGPYATNCTFLMPAIAASLAAALIWWAIVREKEDHA